MEGSERFIKILEKEYQHLTSKDTKNNNLGKKILKFMESKGSEGKTKNFRNFVESGEFEELENI